MGFGCLSIALHEVVKLLHYAEATDVSLIRMGTSGGLGVEPGNVILTKNGYDATLQEGYEVTTAGKKTRFPSPSGENSRDIVRSSRFLVASFQNHFGKMTSKIDAFYVIP